MRSTLLLTLALLLLMKTEWTTGDDLDPFSDEFIDSINNEQSLWKAGRNFGPDTTIDSIRKRLGAVLDKDKFRSLPVFRHNLEDLEIPDEFDWREQSPNCESLREIRDQGQCASCWAVSSAAAMSDRICIHSEGKIKVRLSEENLITCCEWCFLKSGCSGGNPFYAFDYWYQLGVVSGGPYGSSKGCQPYKVPPCPPQQEKCRDHIGTLQCKATCRKGYFTTYDNDRHFARSGAYSIPNDVKQIQAEIMKNGPVVAAFEVYADFSHHKSGVYYHTKGEYLDSHAMKILGWGVENGTPYWLIANSWSAQWGDYGGYVKFIRGEDECGIEDAIVAGLPA